MVQLKPHRQQQVLLAACTTSSPQPAAAAPSVRPLPGIAAEVLFDLRADDARDTSFAAARALLAVPMHNPAEDPQPIAALLDRAEHVRASRDAACHALFEEDRRRREDIAAATWIDETLGRYMAEKTTAILDAVAARPEVVHRHAFLMQLAPVMAQLMLADRTPAADWSAQLTAAFTESGS